MRRLLLGLLVLLAGVGGVKAGRRYLSTATVTPYDLALRPVEENAAEGRRAGLTPVLVGPLRALIRRPTGGHDWFLYWGGNTSTYFQEVVDTLVALQLPAEIGVLVVAPPGYDSEGHPSPERVEADAVLAREWLRRQDGAARIVTGGFSMGIYSALAAAERDVLATVTLGNSMVFSAGGPGRLIRLRKPDFYRVPAAPPKVPMLMIQGERDEPVEEIAAWSGAQVVRIPGVGHVATQTNPVAVREARAFILRSLQGP